MSDAEGKCTARILSSAAGPPALAATGREVEGGEASADEGRDFKTVGGADAGTHVDAMQNSSGMLFWRPPRRIRLHGWSGPAFWSF